MTYKEELMLSIFRSMILMNYTLYEAEDLSRISHSTIHWWVHHRLKELDPFLHHQILALFEYHKKHKRRKK